MKKTKFNQRSLGAMFSAVLLTFVLVAASCSTPHASSSTASCAFVVGDGQEGRDAKLHKIVYPGNQVELEYDEGSDDAKENAYYVPCNPRNYIINDGSVVNANGQKVGDRFNPLEGYTKSGVKIIAWARADWALNQSDRALRDFFTFCFKYTCASDKDQGGGANFSTAGWNGMLGENFSSTMDTTFQAAAHDASDAVWKDHDPAEMAKLGEKMSAAFADSIRPKTGFPEDLFCGSGNSGWKNPDEPGKGDYTCTSVRITIEKVERARVDTSDSSAQGVIDINKQRLTNAQALYGPDAGYWLALQDSIAKCKDAGSACVFNIGSVPTANITPAAPKS